MILVVIALCGSALGAGLNPLGGPDDQPYFSDIFGNPKTHFLIGEKVYVSYFESATTCYNDHVNAPDEMGVAIDSQSTEGCLGGPLTSGTVQDLDGDPNPVPCGPVPGNSGPNEALPDGLLGGSPNAAYLALQEITPGLPYDGIGGPNGANNSGLFIGDVSTTPVTVLAGDHLVVGLSADNQDDAYMQVVLTGGAYMWFDSIANTDPGTRGYGAGGAFVAATSPGDGAYGPGDEMVWEATVHGYCLYGYCDGDLENGKPVNGGSLWPAGDWFYRVNGGGWIGFSPMVHAGAYPTWRLGFTPPGIRSIGDHIEYLYDPTGLGVIGATPVFGDVLIDQPVDLVDDSFSGYGTFTVPNQGSTGYTYGASYMTITQAIADTTGQDPNGPPGNNAWTAGVHGHRPTAGPNPAVYDSRFETGWPIVVNKQGLVIVGDGAYVKCAPGSTTNPVIDGSGKPNDIVEISAPDVTLRRMTVEGTDVAPTLERRCVFVHAPRAHIDECTIHGHANGIGNFTYPAGTGGDRLIVDDCTVYRSAQEVSNGIYLSALKDAQITNNCVYGWRNAAKNDGNGIRVESSLQGAVGDQYTSIRGNQIYDCARGINLDNAAIACPLVRYVKLYDNELWDNWTGCRIHRRAGAWDHIAFWGNTVHDNDEMGLAISNVDASLNATLTVYYNRFEDNGLDPGARAAYRGAITWYQPTAGLVLDAEMNWFDSTTGPASDQAVSAGANAGGLGDRCVQTADGSTGVIDFRPWLNAAPDNPLGNHDGDADINVLDPQWQGNKTIVGSFSPDTYYWTINLALAALNVPCAQSPAPCRTGVLTVGDGTYAEEVNVGAYGQVAEVTIQSVNGSGSTHVEAGQDAEIFHAKIGQSLTLGVDGGDNGFFVYFDGAGTGAGAVPNPTEEKIHHNGEILNVYTCVIDGTTADGILVSGNGARGTIRGNTIRSCRDLVGGLAPAAIHLVNVSNLTYPNPAFVIDGNVIESNDYGIIIGDGSNELTNNTLRYNRLDGLWLQSSGANQVGGSGNNIHNNAGNGVTISLGCTGNTLRDNEIHDNGGYGIAVNSQLNTFNGNKIYGNANPGVQLSVATGNVFNSDDSVANTNCIWDNDFNGNYGALPYGQMENLTTVNVDATNNYWGSANGPFNAMRNPSGDIHNRVSDFILIDPWAITCAGGMADATIALSCGAGWYLTSIPLVPADPMAENVYGALPVFAAYQYNPTTGLYVDLTGVNINWDEGYWLWLMGNETITVYGGEVTTDQIVVLGDAGWQQFSVPSVDIPVTGPDEGGRNDPDIRFRAPGGPWYTYNDAIANGLILPGIFYYDACAGAYDPAMGFNAVLAPWNGYWIETLVDGVEVKVPVEYWITHPWVAPTTYRPMRVDTNGRTPPAPPAIPASLLYALDQETGIVVSNEPNPIRDVHTTTFSVKAAVPIEAILVQIFDLNGTLVFSESQPGNELVWHTDNDYGEYLANGVYLYRVSVLIDGRWIVTEVRKLAIFR
jgi:hypothetical protein